MPPASCPPRTAASFRQLSTHALSAWGALLFVVFALVSVAQAQSLTTVHSFTGGSDGGLPTAGVTRDPAGDLYGTTYEGGYAYGVVFKLDPRGTETVYSFSGGSDGNLPFAPVVRDSAGNIYGTTNLGGSGNCEPYNGCGVVFKIDLAGNETVLYKFTGGSDGCWPYQGLVRDKIGNLYGTTNACGSSGLGTVFKIDSGGNFAVLHRFAGGGSDGGGPVWGHLTMDESGNLYGVTAEGGSSAKCYSGCGVLYKLTQHGKLTLLHSFAGGTTDGCSPLGTVTMDKAGNFYGTTYACGPDNYGTIWKVGRKGKETTLHNFAGSTTDGCTSYAGVSRDSQGNLYGVTDLCGANDGGVLYELSAKGRLTLLHSFKGSGMDGSYPIGEVLRTRKGTLYGTTNLGGTYGYGTVWKYVP